MITLQEMQQIELGIMKAVHSFCGEHNLRYSLAYGTLLGAVRHQGFIPWDDDMDIMMPRPDYEQFLATFSLPGYTVVSPKDDEYHYPYAKVCDTRTFLHEELRNTYPKLGVFIDIFPVDGLPGKQSKQLALYRRQRIRYKLHMSMKYHFSREWSFSKNVLIAIGRTLEAIQSLHMLVLRINTQAQCHPFGLHPHCAVLTGEKGFLPIACEAFDHLDSLCFKDSHFFSIAGYDEYLRNLYGEYQLMPPLEKRKSEHRYTLGWNTEEG